MEQQRTTRNTKATPLFEDEYKAGLIPLTVKLEDKVLKAIACEVVDVLLDLIDYHNGGIEWHPYTYSVAQKVINMILIELDKREHRAWIYNYMRVLKTLNRPPKYSYLLIR